MNKKEEKRLETQITYNDKENKVKITADLIGDDEKHLFSFRIRCNGREKIECTPWNENNYIKADIDEPGFYSAEVWVNIKSFPKAITDKIYCFPKNIKINYNLFLKYFTPLRLPDLELFRYTLPFGEIAVIQTSKISMSKYFLNSFNCYEYNDGRMYVITSCEKHTLNGIDWFFEGITRSENKLIIGDKDILRSGIELSDLEGQIGEFCMFYKCKNGYKLFSDYFGINRIYYYNKKDVFVACNSYHMLLILLKELRIPLSLNENKIKASFSDASTIFETSFSFETDIKDVYCLPVDKSILFSNDKIVFENNNLYDDIRHNYQFDKDDYEKLLYKGVEEITDNLKISLEHTEFDFIRMDLTGGMDTRLLYGAATRLPECLTKKLRIRTEELREKDFEIAKNINSIYKFQYDDLPVECFVEGGISEDKLLQSPLSADMGGYYTGWIQRVVQRINKTLHLTGGVGGIVSKPFMKYFFPDAKSLEDLCSGYGSSYSDIVIYPDGYKHFFDQLKCIMEYLPGESDIHKFENHYLYCRNGHHFRLSYYSDIICIGWTPLQSKSCFKAKLMSWSDEVNMKPEFDLLNIMNPLLSQLPYAEEKQNDEKLKLQEHLYRNGYPKVEVDCAADTTAYDKAKNVKKQSYKYWPDRESIYESRIEQENLLISDEAMLSCLKVLLEYDKQFEDMGIYLYSWITSTSHHPDLEHRRNTVNKKLLMLYYEIQLIYK